MVSITDNQVLDVAAAAFVHCCNRCAGIVRRSATAHGHCAISTPAIERSECFFCYVSATEFYQIAKFGHSWEWSADLPAVVRSAAGKNSVIWE